MKLTLFRRQLFQFIAATLAFTSALALSLLALDGFSGASMGAAVLAVLLAVGVLAALVSWRTRNVALTLVVGMAALVGLQQLT